MTTWRDSTPADVQADLDDLVGSAFDAAQTFLDGRGEFYPFGVSRDPEGLALVAGHDESLGEHPASADVLTMVVAGLRGSSDDVRAAAVVAPVSTADGDAIRVEVEHRHGGPALVVLLPYKVARLRKRVTYGEVSASTGTRQIWER